MITYQKSAGNSQSLLGFGRDVAFRHTSFLELSRNQTMIRVLTSNQECVKFQEKERRFADAIFSD